MKAARAETQARKHGTSRTAAQRDAYLSILRAAEALQRQVTELLRGSDLSLPQYNVLRILRGAGSSGLACGEIGDRLIRFDPDITRLVDRLEKRGLIERTRDVRDRRVVRTRLTRKGLDVLRDLDEPLDELHARQLGHISEAELSSLSTLLEEARQRNA